MVCALCAQVMALSRLQLCPRGYGRTSYHVAEALQLGLAPVQVYADAPWLPYPDTVFPLLGYATALPGLGALLARLAAPDTLAELEAKEAAARTFAASHFSLAGAMDQVARFLAHPGGTQSDLRCTKLPPSPRAETFPEPTWASSLEGANDKALDVHLASLLS